MVIIRQFSKTGSDNEAQLLANIDIVKKAQEVRRAECFSKGLPFYTCVDCDKDFWAKEFIDGRKILVLRNYDMEKGVIVEVLIREMA